MRRITVPPRRPTLPMSRLRLVGADDRPSPPRPATDWRVRETVGGACCIELEANGRIIATLITTPNQITPELVAGLRTYFLGADGGEG